MINSESEYANYPFWNERFLWLAGTFRLIPTVEIILLGDLFNNFSAPSRDSDRAD